MTASPNERSAPATSPDGEKRRSGLYVMPDGTRAFVDFDCEERWIRSMVEHDERREEYEQEQERLYLLSMESLGVIDVEDPDPPRRERPRGLMLNLEDRHDR